VQSPAEASEAAAGASRVALNERATRPKRPANTGTNTFLIQ